MRHILDFQHSTAQHSNSLHQLEFSIGRHEAHGLLGVESCQIDTLMKSHIIELNRLSTAKHIPTTKPQESFERLLLNNNAQYQKQPLMNCKDGPSEGSQLDVVKSVNHPENNFSSCPTERQTDR